MLAKINIAKKWGLDIAEYIEEEITILIENTPNFKRKHF
jgi:hypothetical protein